MKKVACKGKFLFWELENDYWIWNTLGMTGNWSQERNSHTAIRFDIGRELYFNDIRHFGTLKFVYGSGEMNKKLKSIGPDMLSKPPGEEWFKKFLKVPVNICKLLMDQKKISGVGNYVKAEALYRSRISPWREANTLSETEAVVLYRSLIEILQESYSLGGASLRNYRQFEGQEGAFAERLAVYGKEIDPEGREVKTATTPDGRTTYFVDI